MVVQLLEVQETRLNIYSFQFVAKLLISLLLFNATESEISS